MDGKERFLTALHRGRPDRVPLFLRDLTLGLDLCDFTTPEVCADYDAGKAAQAMLASQQRFGQDAVVGAVHDLGLDVEVFGGEVRFPERGVPFVGRAPFAETVPLSAAPLTSGRWPAVCESYTRVAAELAGRAAVAANIEGPVTRAGLLRGLERLALDLVRDRQTVSRLVDLSVELAVEHTRALLAAGADFVFLAAATDGPAAISPRDYLEFTIPGLRRLVQEAHRLGAPLVFHPHGPFTDPRFHDLVDAAVDCGIDGFQFGEGCDLAFALGRWGERVCILGGPDVGRDLIPGPPERIAAVTGDLLAAVGPPGGFVLMASCSLHRGAPLDHLDAMVGAVSGGSADPAPEAAL